MKQAALICCLYLSLSSNCRAKTANEQKPVAPAVSVNSFSLPAAGPCTVYHFFGQYTRIKIVKSPSGAGSQFGLFIFSLGIVLNINIR
jgi:hypothetical protein